MTDKEIKKMIKSAYGLPDSNREKSFIRKHEKRSLQLISIVKTEASYMGIQSILIGALLCAIFFLIGKTSDVNSVWMLSSLIPISATLPMIILRRSERNGMNELEAACRFSLRFVRLVRLLLIGLMSAVLLAVISVILRNVMNTTLVDTLSYVLFPYLLSDYCCMLVARRWHGKESLRGIVVVCLLGGFVPFGIKTVRSIALLPEMFLAVVVFSLFIALIKECILYVKESENLSWNLC